MSRNVFSIFSDDVRHEVGGKISFIGTYSGKMIAQSLPLLAPKLCVTLKITTPSDNPFKKLKAKILKDEELLIESELPAEELEKLSYSGFGDGDGAQANKVISVQLGFVFSPFEADKPCTLRVRVETESEELKGTGLRIELAPEGMQFPVM